MLIIMSAQFNNINNASYIDTLDSAAKERYFDKLKLINGADPYQIKANEWTREVSDFPNVTYPDIVNYLVFKQSAYSLESLKSYKSLEAYNQFVCGWVKDVCLKIINNKCVITARVQHSQSLNATPLKPWIIAEKDGVILAGHCNCMAGLGEVCTHVGAVLFYIDSLVKLRNSKTVTQEAAYWMLPTGIQKVQYDTIQNINFKSAKALRKEMNMSIDPSSGTVTPRRQVASLKNPSLGPSTENEISEFLSKLHGSKGRPVILSLMPEYAEHYVPSCLHESFPLLLSELYDESLNLTTLQEVQDICNRDIFQKINVTEEQSKNVEAETRGQSQCKAWFNFRLGRITASRMKAICKTSLLNPSLSLIRNICYPHENKFSNDATRWGCQHEDDAYNKYISMMKLSHQNFQYTKSGLIISHIYPFMGATPDALISCNCCGNGVLEIKCPFCIRAKNLAESVAFGRFCLENTGEQFQLKRDHAYFYQVQTQIYVTKRDYCDFIVWTESDFHQERIEPDEVLWSDITLKSELFFKNVILPELVGKCFSRPFTPTPQPFAPLGASNNCDPNDYVMDTNTNIICICQEKYDENNGDPAIGCDNQNCKFQWWHFRCAKITTAPKGAWYCPECRKLPQFSKKRSS